MTDAELLDMVMTMLSDLRMKASQYGAKARQDQADAGTRWAAAHKQAGLAAGFEWTERQVQGIINDVNGITRQMPPTSRKWPIA